MRLGAIIVVGVERASVGGKMPSEDLFRRHIVPVPEDDTFIGEPLGCVDIAGRSSLERMVEQFAAIDVRDVSVLMDAAAVNGIPQFQTASEGLVVQAANDLSAAVRDRFADYSREGIERVFVISANTYTETDLLDLFCFHRESRQVVTSTLDREGPLPLWVVDCAKAENVDLTNLFERANTNAKGASNYFIRDYVSRLNHVRDMRKLTSDILRGRCQTTPSGKQVRPGAWIDDGAKIHHRARIVAPAYIGRHSDVRADALITRFSSIERNCCVDCGTVIEDSSILPNTNVGICLDLRQAVANGNKLWNLERNVVIEISDPDVMHSNVGNRGALSSAKKRKRAWLTASREPKPNGHSMAIG